MIRLGLGPEQGWKNPARGGVDGIAVGSAHQELHDQEGKRDDTERETRHHRGVAALQMPEVLTVGALHGTSLASLCQIDYLLS